MFDLGFVSTNTESHQHIASYDPVCQMNTNRLRPIKNKANQGLIARIPPKRSVCVFSRLRDNFVGQLELDADYGLTVSE